MKNCLLILGPCARLRHFPPCGTREACAEEHHTHPKGLDDLLDFLGCFANVRYSPEQNYDFAGRIGTYHERPDLAVVEPKGPFLRISTIGLRA